MVDGINANGDIGVGQGHKITYDKNGNRTSDTYYGARVQADRVFDHTEWTSVWGVTGSDEAGNPTYGYIVQPSAAYSTQYTAVNGLTTEAYDYDSNNRLSHVSRDGVLLDTRFYDGANRVVQTGPAGTLPQEYVTALNGAAGGNGSETRQSTYDQNGRLLHQKVTKSDGAAKYEVNYSQYDGAGNVVSYSMTNQDGDGYTNNYTYTMARFDGYKEARVDDTSDKFDPGSTTSDYDVNGNLTSVTDSTKPENNRTFVNDAQGHVLYVNQGGHTQRQLVVDGEVLGRYGDMINPDVPQDPNTGNPSFINKADFSFGFQPINGKYPTGAPGAIAVQAGDTLESIAHSAYGDSKLWYLIAEANGLSGNSDLRVGQSLTIPNRVSTIHNDSKTFKPYDPSQVIGDTTPNLPMPQADSGGGCGGLGTVIMIAVTVIVAVYTAGAAAYAMSAVQAAEGATAASLSFGSAMSAGASAMLGGTAVGGLTVTGATIGGLSAAVGAAAIGGIAGSLAGQLAGVAMGAQNGISFNQLALSGLSAGIGAGVGGQITGATIGASALRAAATNVALQGIGVVTGLQHSFNWTSVAASAAGGAVGGALNAGGASSISQSINNEIGGVLGRTVTGVLVGTAAGLTTSILRGGRVAMQQVATDAFGNALGQSLADAVGPDAIEQMTAESTMSLTNKLAAGSDGAVMFGAEYSLGMTAREAMGSYGSPANGAPSAVGMTGLFGTYSGYGVRPFEGAGDAVRNERLAQMQAQATREFGQPPSGLSARPTQQAASPLYSSTPGVGSWSAPGDQGNDAWTYPVPTPHVDATELPPLSTPGTIGAMPDWSNRMANIFNAWRGGQVSASLAVQMAWNDESRSRSIGVASAVTGVAEAGVGAVIAAGGGPLAPVGVLMVGHGSDTAISGIRAAGGVQEDTGLVKALTYAGIAHRTSEKIDAGLGLLFGITSMGAPSVGRLVVGRAASGEPALADNIAMRATSAGSADNMALSSAARNEAASKIWQARQILADTRPDLTIAERNQIIKAFDLESFRITIINSPVTEFRYFDGLDGGAGLYGRWSTPQWLNLPEDRISILALPNNQATRAATVTLQPGTTVFQGTVAPQFKFGPNLMGGGQQTYNALGPWAVIKELP